MLERDDVQESNGALLKLVAGLALEDVEVVGGGGQGNCAATPEH